jgi:hypothetical protein
MRFVAILRLCAPKLRDGLPIFTMGSMDQHLKSVKLLKEYYLTLGSLVLIGLHFVIHSHYVDSN